MRLKKQIKIRIITEAFSFATTIVALIGMITALLLITTTGQPTGADTIAHPNFANGVILAGISGWLFLGGYLIYVLGRGE
tara:strand:- start:69 stop:308 length:240 start_codon:yes stop_codon:yes gene_type:complete